MLFIISGSSIELIHNLIKAIRIFFSSFLQHFLHQFIKFFLNSISFWNQIIILILIILTNFFSLILGYFSKAFFIIIRRMFIFKTIMARDFILVDLNLFILNWFWQFLFFRRLIIRLWNFFIYYLFYPRVLTCCFLFFNNCLVVCLNFLFLLFYCRISFKRWFIFRLYLGDLSLWYRGNLFLLFNLSFRRFILYIRCFSWALVILSLRNSISRFSCTCSNSSILFLRRFIIDFDGLRLTFYLDSIRTRWWVSSFYNFYWCWFNSINIMPWDDDLTLIVIYFS